MKKRILSMMVALCLVLSLLPVTVLAADDSQIDQKLVYDYDKGTETIIVSPGSSTQKYAVEWKYDGYSNPPYDKSEIYNAKQIKFDSNITHLSRHFAEVIYGSQVSEIILPDRLISIAEPAGNGLGMFANVHTMIVPNTLKSFPRGFSNSTNLTSVILKPGLSVIDMCAFDGSGLTSINIPDSVTKIGGYAFRNCADLTTVSISKNVTSYVGAFNHSGLTSVHLEDGLTLIDDRAFGYTKLKSVIIPDSVSYIGAAAFGGCEDLISVTLPNNPDLEFGYAAFHETGIEELIIPDGITHLNQDAFKDLKKLKYVVFPASIEKVEEYDRPVPFIDYFMGCDSMTDIYYGGSEEQWYDTFGTTYRPIATVHFNSTGPSADSSVLNVDVNHQTQPIQPSNRVPFSITADVTNKSNDTITNLHGSVVFDTNSSNFVIEPKPDSNVELAPGQSTTFTWNGYVENPSDTTMEGQYTLSFDCTSGQLYSKQHSIPVILGSGNTHTVTFDLNGGSGAIAPQVVHDRGHVLKPTDPTRSGYTFNGWYTEKIDTLTDGSERLTWTDWYGNIVNGKPVTEDITLHAGWLSNKLIYGKDTFNFENVPYDFYGVYNNPTTNGYSMREDYKKIFDDEFLFGNTESTARQNLTNMMNGKWSGSCFGMSSVIALIKAGKIDPGYFQKGAISTHDFNLPKDDETVRSLINYYAVMQMTDITKLRSSHSSRPSVLYQVISNLDLSKYPVLIEFDMWRYPSEQDRLNENKSTRTPGGAHAVLGYDYTIDPDTNDYIISIWDPATKTAPNSCDTFSTLRIKSDFSDSVFENFPSSSLAFYDSHIKEDGKEYWVKSYIKSTLSVEGGLYDYHNLQDVLKSLGYVHGYDSGPTQIKTNSANIAKSKSTYAASRSSTTSDYVLYTNYPSFEITCSDGTKATITNGHVVGDLQISDVCVLNDIGCELLTAYLLPQLNSDSSYQIVPVQANSTVTGLPLTKYSTILVTSSDSTDKSKSGIYASVDMEGTGTITIFGDATTTTSFATPTKHSIDVVRDDAETPWYSTAATATTTGMTVAPTSTDTKISTTDDVPVQITLGNTYNKINFNPVDVDTNGVNVVEAPDSKGTAIIVKDDNELQRNVMTHTAIFYPMSGAAIETQSDIIHGSIITKPADPIRAGYKFDGWYLDSDYNTLWSFDTPITEDIRLFAKWTESNPNPSEPSKPSSPGSSGSSSSGDSDSSYSIAVPSGLIGGKISVSPSSASAGQRVTITTTPNKGYKLGKLTVVDSKGKELVLTDRGEGKYTFTMPSGKITISAAFEPTQPLAFTWNNPFIDVAENAWYYEAVKFVNQQGLMNGTSSNTFSPDSKLTRAQLAQVLYNKEGRPSVNTTSSFTDVVADAWYANAVIWASEKGIIAGYGNGAVGPNDFITREQLATILWRYSNSPESNYQLQFTDVNLISNYALDALKWAAENGIVNGYGDGRLGPNDNASRSQVAQMLKNCFNLT